MTKALKIIAIYLTESAYAKNIRYRNDYSYSYAIWIPTMFIAIKNVIMQVILPIFK